MSQVINIVGAVQDGTTPVVRTPSKQPVTIDRATDVTFNLVVYGSSGSQLNLTNDAIILTVRQAETSATASVSRIFTTTGLSASAGLSQNDTNLPGGTYLYDVRRTATGTGITDVVVPESRFYVNQNVGRMTASADSLSASLVVAYGLPVPQRGKYLRENMSGTLVWDKSATTEDIYIYMNPTGSDSNDGLTPSTAVKTVDAALRLVPTTWNGKCRIVCASGTYTVPASTFRMGIPIGSGSEPCLFQGGFDTVAGPFTHVATGSGDYGTSTQLAADAYIGAFLRVVSGTYAGHRGCVTRNDYHSFTLNTDTLAPTVGDTYVIERPNVSFNLTGKVFWISSTAAIALAFFGIKFQVPIYMVFDTMSAMICCCEVDCLNSGFMVTADKSQTQCYTLRGFFSDIFHAEDVFNSVYVHDDGGNGVGFYIDEGSYLGSVVLKNASFYTDEQSFAYLFSPFIVSGSMTFDQGSRVDLDNSGARKGVIRNSPGVGLTLTNGSECLYMNAGLTVTGSVGDGVYLTNNAWGTFAGIDGGNNGGVGFHVDKMSSANVSACTVSGTAGEVTVGIYTNSWATVAASGGLTDTNRLCRVQP